MKLGETYNVLSTVPGAYRYSLKAVIVTLLLSATIGFLKGRKQVGNGNNLGLPSPYSACYRLNVCVLLTKSICWKPNPQCEVRSVGVGAFMNGIMPL